MSTVIDLFERHGYVLELLACVAATTWKLERQERFAARLTGILLAEACFTIVWSRCPTTSTPSRCAPFCCGASRRWASGCASASRQRGRCSTPRRRAPCSTSSTGAKLLQNAVYHMDRQYWAWSRWVYLGLFVLLFAVCCMVLQQMMRQQRQQMELSKETVELINIKCHDIRKQLYTLGSRVPTEELDELKKAVDIYGSTVKTGNETLDVLLAERSIVCKGRGIQLDYIADGAKLDFLKPGEVYSLFGNALDNAIEAVTSLEPDRRYIGLQVRAERGMLLIRMENCAAEPLHFVDGLPQTTKGTPGGTVLALRASAASCSSTAAP